MFILILIIVSIMIIIDIIIIVLRVPLVNWDSWNVRAWRL